jgi:hypothetical protein
MLLLYYVMQDVASYKYEAMTRRAMTASGYDIYRQKPLQSVQGEQRYREEREVRKRALRVASTNEGKKTAHQRRFQTLSSCTRVLVYDTSSDSILLPIYVAGEKLTVQHWDLYTTRARLKVRLA